MEFEWLADNAVHVSVDGSDAAIQTMADLFSSAEMRSRASPAVRSAVGSKTFDICSLNPLGPVVECLHGDLLKTLGWEIIREIVREAFPVSKAEGGELPRRVRRIFCKTKRFRRALPLQQLCMQEVVGGRWT